MAPFYLSSCKSRTAICTTLFKLLPLLLSFFCTAMQAGEKDTDFKQRGLHCLHSNSIDSALYYLQRAADEQSADCEVLGGLALAYIMKNNDRQAIVHAKKARRLSDSACVDAFLAAVLAYEQQGMLRLRDKWLRNGLQCYPNDYLLLFHGGRINLIEDARMAEMFLLYSVHSNPAFEESHFLLGESMYRQGENVKALMSLYFFLLLENDSERSSEILAQFEYLYSTWAASLQGISRIDQNPGISCSFVPADFDATATGKASKCEWLVEQTVKFIDAMPVLETTSDNAHWLYYSHFFAKAAKLGLSRALAWHVVYSRYPAEAMSWIAGNGTSYSELINWLSVQ